jgi:glutaredoxin
MPIYKTLEYYINKANNIHNNKYDYSLIKFEGVMNKVKIICLQHGVWEVTLDNHINKKSGCPKCKGRNKTKEEWIIECNKIHNNKYDYSLIKNIKNTSQKIKIICHEHGVFKKELNNHIYLNKQGCPKCSKSGRKKLTLNNIKDKINNINTGYEYDWDSFKGYYDNINIKCFKHGWFKQQISNHLFGQRCPNCNRSVGEEKIKLILDNLKINYITQHKFDDCINPKTGYKLIFDFYIPLANTCIEYDGELHFKPVKYYGGKETLDEYQYRDKIKTKYCQNNNINLIRISYLEYKIIEKIINERSNNN